MRKTLIIAEIGVNHNGDMILAKKMIDEAVAIGVDIVKFQTFNADDLIVPHAKKASYQLEGYQDKETQFEMLKKLELSEEMHFELLEYCSAKKIKFLSSAFDIKTDKFLNKLNLEYFKIPSGEITNLPYLEYIGSLNKKIILSTGMAYLDEIEFAINILNKSGTSKKNITVLHCSTEYPAPKKFVNLNFMNIIREAFDIEVGYSDHTEGIEVAIAAVALGAKIIEKHFTLNKKLAGPDHKASTEPSEFKLMIEAIRNIEIALGDGIKELGPAELNNRIIVRKSIVASKKIKKGDIFDSSNIAIKRPGTGISPVMWADVLGLKATKDFEINEIIEI